MAIANQTKWTPGPWWYGEPEPRTGRIMVISRPTATGVAIAFRGEEAALIAAAPDMAEALRRALLHLPTCTRPGCSCAYCRCRDALAKSVKRT